MTIQRAHSMSKLTRKRLNAARRRVIAAESDYEAGNKSNDLALRAISSLTLAQAAYSKSISEYNKSLRDLLYRTGRILPADGVSLLGTDGLPIVPPLRDEDYPKPTGPELKKPSDSDMPGDDETEEEEDPQIPPKPKPSPNIALNGKRKIPLQDASDKVVTEFSDDSVAKVSVASDGESGNEESSVSSETTDSGPRKFDE